MRLETAQIPGREIPLSGLRYLPDAPLKRIALLYAHGFTAGKYSLDGIAGYLAGRGYEGLTFDFVGHKLGGTGGKMLRMEQAVENAQDALLWLNGQVPGRRIVLLGHSMGAAASLATAARALAAGEATQIAGILSLCMGVDPMIGFQSAVGKAMQAQRADYVEGTPAPQLMPQIEPLLPLSGELGDLPALFVAAQQDVLFSTERVAALAQAAGRRTQMQTIEAAHVDAPDRARRVVLKWLDTLESGSPTLQPLQRQEIREQEESWRSIV
jgi:pimeloyl-ACP methyl ester carboxylesterase